MQKVNRLILISLLTASMTGGVWAMEDVPQKAKAAEYKRGDANFYPKAELLKANPSAVIIPKSGYTQNGDSYFFTPKIRAPKDIYIEVLNDWIEPITPPGATSLGIAPNAMQVREPRGDVRIALPSAPANFAPVTDGMMLPNGAVVKTGADGTAAVLFGGVDSARLMPDSEAAVQQTVTAQARSVEVDLTVGGVFSKVGTQVGVKGDYEVHTPFGNASAQGGDFVTILSNSRADVWVAQGTVYFSNPDDVDHIIPQKVTSDGTGPLKILRNPGITDPHQALLADVETTTAILNFIPLANQKIKALRDKTGNGATLTADEQAYLARIKQVPSLIKLALVEPPAPVVVVEPVAPAPKPGPIVPVQINLRADGGVEVNGAPMDLDNLKARLADIAKSNPTQPLLITGRENVTPDQLKKVLAICKTAKLKKVTVAKAVLPPPPVAPGPVEPAATPAPTAMPAPAAAPAPAPAPAPRSPANLKPLIVVVHPDGTVKFQGATLGLAEFQLKLETMVKATPDQSIVIKAEKTVPDAKLKEVLAICATANVKQVTVGTPAPTSAPAPPPQPPSSTAPAAVSAPAAAPAPQALSTGEMVPVEVYLRPDGNVDLNGQMMSLYELKWRLSTITNANAALSFVITGRENASADQLDKVLAIFKGANIKHVSVGTHSTMPAPTRTEPLATTPEMPSPAPAPPPQPPPSTTPAAVSVPPTAPAHQALSTAPAPPTGLDLFTKETAPVKITLRPDGNVDLFGKTISLDELKWRLAKIAKANPAQPIVILGKEKATPDQLKKVLALCHGVKLKTKVMPAGETQPPPTALPQSANPAAVSAPATAPAPPSAGNSHSPDNVVYVNPDGTVKFRGATMDLANFESKLKAAVKTTPDQSFIIEAGTDVPYEKIKAVLGIFADAKVDKVSVDINASGPSPAAPETVEPAAMKPPAPPVAAAPMPAPVVAPAPAAPPAPSSPASTAPMRAIVRVDGKINFQGATYELLGFKLKLEAVMKASPDQAIMLRAGKNVALDKFQAALDICHSVQVKNLTVVAPAPTSGSAAANLPTPDLLMHSPGDSMSSNAPPMAPSGLPAPTPSAPGTPVPGSP